MNSRTYEAFGYRMGFQWDTPKFEPVVGTMALPDWKVVDSDPHALFCIRQEAENIIIERDGKLLGRVTDFSFLRHSLKRHCHLDLATYAPDLVFVHAGVVCTDFGLLVIPGKSFAGKSTLVRELTRLGAVYYSDEYAVLDKDGMVTSFPRPLCSRLEGGDLDYTDAASLGWTSDLTPQPISYILVTQYQADGAWAPTELTSGQTVLKMLENTVCAQTEPQRALTYISKAVRGAQCVETRRGESTEAAHQILTWMKNESNGLK